MPGSGATPPLRDDPVSRVPCERDCLHAIPQ
jgi:hypothetical protein